MSTCMLGTASSSVTIMVAAATKDHANFTNKGNNPTNTVYHYDSTSPLCICFLLLLTPSLSFLPCMVETGDPTPSQ